MVVSLTVVFLLWSAPVTLIGMLCCVTLILVMPGLGLIGLGALPLTAIVAHYVKKTNSG